MQKKETYKQWIPLVFVIVLFVLISYFTQQNTQAIKKIISSGGSLGIFIYILITIIAIVAAPLTSIPLIPLVVQVWGIFLTSIFSIIGWTIGSLGAFWVARTFGVSIVSKIESLEKILVIAKKIPEKKTFWYMIFLRMTIPVDILSYALGLFTNVSWKMFFITTFLGVIPVTFLFAYVGALPIKMQIPLMGAGVVLIIFFFFFQSRRNIK